jgi:DEAD/DEAH box helicase domain-containing protein
MPNNRAVALDAFLRALRNSPFFAPQVVHQQTIPGNDAEYAQPSRPWPVEIEPVLRAAGIERLYAHQVKAMDLVRSGRHTVVATPTASGKTLVYTLPLLERVIADPSSRTLYLSPLKALAQDQLRALSELAEPRRRHQRTFPKKAARQPAACAPFQSGDAPPLLSALP